MIRKITGSDREDYLSMAKEFYNSDAVMHSVPDDNFERTFSELMRSDEYAECYILEADGRTAGYALLAKTFSQEAGGAVCWIEELYVRPCFRGRGLGREFLAFIKALDVKRLRLEVEDCNDRAKALYERCGFKQLGYEQMFIDK